MRDKEFNNELLNNAINYMFVLFGLAFLCIEEVTKTLAAPNNHFFNKACIRFSICSIASFQPFV